IPDEGGAMKIAATFFFGDSQGRHPRIVVGGTAFPPQEDRGNPAMDRSQTMTTGARTARDGLAACITMVALALAGCQTATGPLGEVAGVDAAQGSSENIASLTSVIQRSPNDAEAYNVRGTALGRGGRYKEALEDFDTAIRI